MVDTTPQSDIQKVLPADANDPVLNPEAAEEQREENRREFEELEAEAVATPVDPVAVEGDGEPGENFPQERQVREGNLRSHAGDVDEDDEEVVDPLLLAERSKQTGRKHF